MTKEELKKEVCRQLDEYWDIAEAEEDDDSRPSNEPTPTPARVRDFGLWLCTVGVYPD